MIVDDDDVSTEEEEVVSLLEEEAAYPGQQALNSAYGYLVPSQKESWVPGPYPSIHPVKQHHHNHHQYEHHDVQHESNGYSVDYSTH